MLPEYVQKYRDKYQKKQLKYLKNSTSVEKKKRWNSPGNKNFSPPIILVVMLIDFKDMHALLILQKN